MAEGGPSWQKAAQTGRRRPRLAAGGPGWQQATQAGRRWQKGGRRVSPTQCRLEVASGSQHSGRGEGGHVQVGHWEGQGGLHLLGGPFVCGLEALDVQAKHRGQLPDGQLLACPALALAPATTPRTLQITITVTFTSEVYKLLVTSYRWKGRKVLAVGVVC